MLMRVVLIYKSLGPCPAKAYSGPAPLALNIVRGGGPEQHEEMIWTIGHSTRQADEFMGLLAKHEIQAIVDVRRFPGSRRHPQFGQAALEDMLSASHIEYHWIAALGGRRRSGAPPNNAWRNPSFSAYAEYIETPEFATGLAELRAHGSRVRTAIMCAELLWWRCHRRIISDVLSVHGVEVIHIVDERHATAHPLTSPAQIIDGRLSYVPVTTSRTTAARSGTS
jgi:uncharacterized protein (DUF488 family)